jgi:cyclopropane fatty-acyl-phospholipid synthase-like methyltransferase
MNQEPSTLLLDHLHLLSKGRVLDVAMGKGRNAIYLAKHGFDVEGVDIDQKAVSACVTEAKSKDLKIKAEIADLTDYTISPNCYDAIICFNYLQRDLIPQMKEGLRKGGIVIYQTFLIDQHIRFGKPKHREYCFEHNELLRFFRNFRIIYYKEGFVSEEKAVASLVAQKEK